MRLCLKTSGHANTFNPAGLCNKVDARQKRIRKRGKRQVQKKSGSLCLQLFSSIVKREREKEKRAKLKKNLQKVLFFSLLFLMSCGSRRRQTCFCDVYIFHSVYTHTIRNPIPLNWTGGILLQQASPPYWFIPSSYFSYFLFFLLLTPFVSVGGRHETDCANHLMPPTRPRFPFRLGTDFSILFIIYFLRRLNIGDVQQPTRSDLKMKQELGL